MTNDETNRAAVVAGTTRPKQAAETRDRWWWVEHPVWTERMLTRLAASEPTTVWYGLWDKVWAERNLQAAFWAVWRNAGAPGVDGQTVAQFDDHAEAEIARLGEELRAKRYRCQPARRVWIPKPGTTERRPLGIPAVRDRTVEAALRHVLEPIFERDFLDWHFHGGKKWPRKKSLQKLQEKLRPLTKRTNGRSLRGIIARVNPILRGWHGYFRESCPAGLSGPDGWLRRRLRALLRKREKRPGYGLSRAESRRWPNRWFAAQGLFSLEHGSCAYG